MGSGNSGHGITNTRGSRDDGFPKVHGYTTKLHEGRQGKHIVGHNNYEPGRSVLHMSMARAQELVETFGGTGKWIEGTTKERVDFGFVIGTYVNAKTGDRSKTTKGFIVYSNDGTHIIPRNPNGEN